MAAVWTTGKALRRPAANLYDIPELLPGASSSATPAQRAEFEDRCRQVYAEEERSGSTQPNLSWDVSLSLEELQNMFPSLDASLVRVMVAEARTPEAAMDTLLALAGAIAEPGVPPSSPEGPPLEDAEAFPALVDAQGWQVYCRRHLEEDPDQALGSAWCDVAKSIASTPAPKPEILPSKQTASEFGAATRRSHGSRRCKVAEPNWPHQESPETDYEFRHRLGKARIQNRRQFRRGARCSQGKEIEGAGRSNATEATSDSDVSDE